MGPDDWLDADFEPSKATAAYLRGVFLQNDITAASSAKKADLVKLFNAQILPKLQQLRATRRVQGSAKGIRDLRDGAKDSPTIQDSSSDDDMDVDEPGPSAGRRGKAVATSKGKGAYGKTRKPRSRSASVLDSDEEEPAKKPTKRPRTSVAKSKRAAEERMAEKQPIKEEDEMEVDEPAPKKQSPRRASPKRSSPKRESGRQDVPSRASIEGRRRSSGQHRSSDDAQSGFSDYNPFQESERRKSRRVSPPKAEIEESHAFPAIDDREQYSSQTAPQRSPQPVYYKPSPLGGGQPSQPRRKSLSAMPQREERYEYDLPVGPFTAERPNRPRHTLAAPGRSGMSSSASMPAFNNYMIPVEALKAPADKYREIIKKATEQATQASSSSSPIQQKAVEVRRKSTGSGAPVVRPLPKRRSPSVDGDDLKARRPWWQLALSGLILTALLMTGDSWRRERFERGYCDHSASSSVWARRVSADDKAIPLASCIPCPSHAHCYDGKLEACDEGYIRQPSIFSLNGFLPIADTCEPDTAMLKRRDAIEKKIKSTLRIQRGLIECGSKPTSVHIRKRSTDNHALMYGMTKQQIIDSLRSEQHHPYAAAVSTGTGDIDEGPEHDLLRSDFEAVFDSRLKFDLRSLTHEGQTYYTTMESDKPLSCRLRQSAWHFFKVEWPSFAMVGFFTGLYFWIKSQLRQTKEEKELVNQLVDEALNKLQTQMTWNYRDPVLTPYARMDSAQLRDEVLLHEHSDKQRARLWKRVERVILKNANVRRFEAESHGEPVTCWEWIGSTMPLDDEGRASRRQSRAGPRVSFVCGADGERLYPQL